MITEAEVRAVYNTAPEHVKEYVNSDEVFNAFHLIRKTHNLHLDTADNLAMAINAAILGVKPFSELPSLLRDALPGVDDETRTKVVADINDKILVPMREHTKKRAEEATAKQKIILQPIQAREVVAEQVLPPTHTEIPTVAVERSPVLVVTPVHTPAPVTPSVIEQKMTAPAPVTLTPSDTPHDGVAPQAVTPSTPATPVAPVRYHGTDPYRMPIE